MHLPLWSEQQDRASTPFTPAVNGLLALDQALKELEEQGGWHARHARYHQLADRVARLLQRCDVEPMLDHSEFSCVLHSYRLPEGMSYETVHDGLKLRGFVVYAGQGELAAEMFRISTMGDITDYDMGRLLTALIAVFKG
jgi:2-aminoethylphosphonate-pyruvate transaminase